MDDRDNAQDSSHESLLQFLSEHRESSQRRGEREHPLRTRRWKAAALLLGVVAAVLVAVGFVLWKDLTHHRSVSHAPAVTTDPHKSRPGTLRHVDRGATSQRKTVATSPPESIHVILTAARSDSWVQIRRNNSSGTVLFDGVVSEGRSIRFVGRRFWARFGALGNFELTVDGQPVHPSFSGTVDALITAAAIRPVPAG